jgi:hypothetical protein
MYFPPLGEMKATRNRFGVSQGYEEGGFMSRKKDTKKGYEYML